MCPEARAASTYCWAAAAWAAAAAGAARRRGERRRAAARAASAADPPGSLDGPARKNHNFKKICHTININHRHRARSVAQGYDTILPFARDFV